ncbi:hypothetical protein FSP39_016979 [Pinctada imbricata]|uniref:2'-phosphotransferase n=1 Tax=Pinctada imbricata TaxID=66713 RepID=A0AA89BZJ6_PINIB|nr:hypothetical protein FSP39_016979 [Pinctada imbricata]
MASDLGNLKDYRKTGPLDDGAEKPISKGRGRGRGFSFKNRQMNSQGVGVHSACDSATTSSQTHSQTGQFNHYNENSSAGIKFSPKTRSSMDNGFNPVGNDDLRTQRKEDDVKEFYCPHGGAKPKQNYVQGVGNHGIQSSMDRGSDNTSTMTGMRGKGFGTPTSPSHGSNSQLLNKSNYVSSEDSRGRSHYRDEEFNHERDTSPDRTGFQHRGQHAHQSRSLQRDVEHERESSPDRQGFCDEEPHKVHTPTHSKNEIGYTTPNSVQNNSATNRNKRDRSDERQKGSRYNGRYKDRENWGGNRRSGNGWNSPKNGNYPSSPQSGNEWSSPKSDTSQSPMSETSSPRHKKYRDKNPMVHLSKTLSFILRHGAERKGFKMMQGGYLYVDEILQLPELHEFTEKDVEFVVKNNDKQRYALETEDGTERLKIRANQGHSIQVEGLELTPVLDHKEIPVVVHGTYLQTWNIIKKEGLSRMNRNHIHFAPGEPQDNGVISGMRASCEVMIFIDAQKSLNEGLKFYRSANNVILSPGDPDGYIHPRYFSTVLQRVPRDVLEFDPDVQVIPRKAQDPVTSPVGPSIPGLAVDTTTRRKKKGKRRGKGAGNDSQQGTREVAKNMNDSKAKNVDDSVTMEDSRTKNLDDSVTMDGDNQHVKEDDSSLNIDWNLQEALGEDVPIEGTLFCLELVRTNQIA